MLIVANNLRELSFGKLMEVYAEGNLENGHDLWPNEPEGRQIALAEQEFYHYLREVFFKTPRAFYFIWEEADNYVSALRIEPYRDGFLLEALETAPMHRRKGYAAKLMEATLLYIGNEKIYSHVGKRNLASLRTHESCGFRIVSDFAVYADGSVNQRCFTLCVDRNS